MDNNIGLIAFDFPCHGDSKSKKNDFSLKKCIEYLDRVYDYAVNNYPNVKISLMGGSFGGYVALNKIKSKNNFYKVILKYPAVNFIEALEKNLKINEHYFDKKKVLGPLNGIRLYKDDYLDFKKNDVMNNFNKLKDNIYIIHGDHDDTILLSDVEAFSKKYNIPLTIAVDGIHGLKNNNKELDEFIIKCIREE